MTVSSTSSLEVSTSTNAESQEQNKWKTAQNILVTKNRANAENVNGFSEQCVLTEWHSRVSPERLVLVLVAVERHKASNPIQECQKQGRLHHLHVLVAREFESNQQYHKVEFATR